MTCEIVILNKEGMVVAADSAVTVGQSPHPRYSKNANKIFDLSSHGTVAATIFSSAEIDQIPWELALKLYKKSTKNQPEPETLKDYRDSLISFLQCHHALFPSDVLNDQLTIKFTKALSYIISLSSNFEPRICDLKLTGIERTSAWNSASKLLSEHFSGKALCQPLTDSNLQGVLAKIAELLLMTSTFMDNNSDWEFIDKNEACHLAIEALFKIPNLFLQKTGIVFSGYGAKDIFPSFKSYTVYGHIGSEIAYEDFQEYSVNHEKTSWIEPFAQSSMIQRFTDGFDFDQERMLKTSATAGIEQFVKQLRDSGLLNATDDLIRPIISVIEANIISDWKKANWDKNFHPLRRVLGTLSVQEMAHLAETLLVLESLRERVTSPSESVGGPVDVAVITKAEGLVWIKRKQYFEAGLNPRYVDRSRSLT